jgi:hypothetical protein
MKEHVWYISGLILTKGKSHYSEENLFQCQFVHHSSNIDWPRPEVVIRDEKPVSVHLRYSTISDFLKKNISISNKIQY